MGYIPYIFFSIICVVCLSLDYVFKKRLPKMIVFIIPIGLFFILGILKSNTVGIDTEAYSEMYTECTKNGFVSFLNSKKIEFIFYGQMYIFSFLKLPEIFFNILNFSIICVSIFLAFYRLKQRLFFLCAFFFIGFFSMSFSGIRQAVSISISTLGFIILFAWDNVSKKKKYIIFYALIVTATLYHETTIILAVVPLLALIKIKEYQIPFIIFFIILFLPFLLSRSLIFIVPLLNSYYEPYDSRVSILMLLECAFIVAYYFLFHTKFLAKVRTKFFSDNIVFTTQDSNYFWIFIFGCFFMAFNSSSSIMARLAMYFYLGFIYYLFRFVDNFKNETIKKIFYISLTVFLGLYFIYNTPTLGLVPYAFR